MAAVMQAALGTAAAQTPQSAWIKDAQKGCQIFNPSPSPNESVRWSGACTAGYAEGPGTLEWLVDGQKRATQKGTFRGGKMQGIGTYEFADGTRFEGEYQDGSPGRRGVFLYPTGARYEGEIERGVAHGKGIHTMENGARYEGEFRRGKIIRGVVLLPNGLRYEGELEDLRPQGRGVMLKPDGSKASGLWSEGKLIRPD